MAKASSLLKAIVVVVGFGLGILGGIWLVQRSPDPIQAGVNDGTTLEGDRPTNPTIEALKAELERVTQEELTTGCVEWDPRLEQRILCGESQVRVDAVHERLVEEIRKLEQREPEAMAAAIANIRTLAEDASLEVRFEGSSANPYNNRKRIEFYVDEKGVAYWINLENNEIVNVDFSGSRVPIRVTPRLGQEELRAIAEGFLAEHVSNFEQFKAEYQHRILDCREGEDFCTFRWEKDKAAYTVKNEMPPFVQVIVSVAGEIAGFTNTQSLYEEE